MNRDKLLAEKHSGILLPLFSMKSGGDIGIGDISSFSLFLDFCSQWGADIVEILPINDMAPGNNCPYTAMSGFALDPVYVSLEDFPEIKKKVLLESKKDIDRIKKSKGLLYDDIRKIKFKALWLLYEEFLKKENSPEKKEFENFKKKNAYWLDDYAFFRFLKDRFSWKSWTLWPYEYSKREKFALDKLYAKNGRKIDFFKYVQWIISRQWAKLKEKADSLDIKIYGDLPFMVNQESSDIWSRQNEFLIDCSIGAPPDAFSEKGQEWGLPAYNWWEIEKKNFEWWRQKVKKAEDFYHIYRLDHMVGFFRTWIVPKNKNEKPHFDIEDEREQIARGKRFLMAVLSESHLLPIAEDLGLIPPYVGKTLKEFNVPGYKVMRWEKKYPEGYYIHPKDYEPISLATTSTHDTESLKTWWKTVKNNEKKLFLEMAAGEKKLPSSYEIFWKKTIEILSQASSKFVILPLQDILGLEERINTPNTVGIHNWSWRMPFNIESGTINKDFSDKLNHFKKTMEKRRIK